MSRLDKIKECNSNLKNYCKENKKNIIAQCFGSDKHKKECKRGINGGVARLCSKTLRKYIPDTITSDNTSSEFCVMSTHSKKCCFPDINTMISTPKINIAQTVSEQLNDSKEENHRDDRWRSFMSSKIGSDYPSNESNSRLRIRVNGNIWIDHYIRLTPLSTIIKTSSPSGYKYNDRVSFGRMVMIQGNSNKNLVFYITRDPTKTIDAKFETLKPVVNGVGFWSLLNDGGIRKMIHINQVHALNVCFGFLIHPNSNAMNIKLELVVNRDGINDQILTLYEYHHHGHVAVPPNHNTNSSQSPLLSDSTSSISPPPNTNHTLLRPAAAVHQHNTPHHGNENRFNHAYNNENQFNGNYQTPPQQPSITDNNYNNETYPYPPQQPPRNDYIQQTEQNASYPFMPEMQNTELNVAPVQQQQQIYNNQPQQQQYPLLPLPLPLPYNPSPAPFHYPNFAHDVNNFDNWTEVPVPLDDLSIPHNEYFDDNASMSYGPNRRSIIGSTSLYRTSPIHRHYAM